MNTLINTLVTFELAPESVTQAVIPMTQEEFDMFSKSHGCMINCSDMTYEQIDIINVMICALNSPESEVYDYYSDLEKEYHSKFHKYIFEDQDLPLIPTKYIYHGFALYLK